MLQKNTYPLILIAAIILLFIVNWMFYRNFTNLKQRGEFHTQRTGRPLVTVENIQVWMTFDYLNRAYRLPDDYLKNDLGITNQKYPKITILNVASYKKVEKVRFLNQVKDSIKKYQSVTASSTSQ